MAELEHVDFRLFVLVYERGYVEVRVCVIYIIIEFNSGFSTAVRIVPKSFITIKNFMFSITRAHTTICFVQTFFFVCLPKMSALFPSKLIFSGLVSLLCVCARARVIETRIILFVMCVVRNSEMTKINKWFNILMNLCAHRASAAIVASIFASENVFEWNAYLWKIDSSKLLWITWRAHNVHADRNYRNGEKSSLIESYVVSYTLCTRIRIRQHTMELEMVVR